MGKKGNKVKVLYMSYVHISLSYYHSSHLYQCFVEIFFLHITKLVVYSFSKVNADVLNKHPLGLSYIYKQRDNVFEISTLKP